MSSITVTLTLAEAEAVARIITDKAGTMPTRSLEAQEAYHDVVSLALKFVLPRLEALNA